MSYWKEYWYDKQSSMAREGVDNIYCKLAKERLFHLGVGGDLLEFGCGAGEALKYMASSFSHIVAVDFSPCLIQKAKKLMEENKGNLYKTRFSGRFCA